MTEIFCSWETERVIGVRCHTKKQKTVLADRAVKKSIDREMERAGAGERKQSASRKGHKETSDVKRGAIK